MNRKAIYRFIVIILAIMVLSGCQSEDNYDIREVELTEREQILTNALNSDFGGAIRLFEIAGGQYQFRAYHYQYGHLVDEIELFGEVETQNGDLIIVSSISNDGQLHFGISVAGVGTSQFFPLEVDEINGYMSGSLGQGFELGEEEVAFAIFQFTNTGSMAMSVQAINEYGISEFVELFEDYAHVVFFTAQRVNN